MGSAAIASFLANTHHAPWLRAAVLQDGDTTAIRYVHSSVAALRGKYSVRRREATRWEGKARRKHVGGIPLRDKMDS